MTGPDARNALANKCERWPNAHLQPEENRMVVAALRSQPGPPSREEVMALLQNQFAEASLLYGDRLVDAILALTPSHEAPAQEPVAWQVRQHLGLLGVTDWRDIPENVFKSLNIAIECGNKEFETRPLYAAPASHAADHKGPSLLPGNLKGPASMTTPQSPGPDPLKPSVSLLVKLGSIAVHADEYHNPDGHPFDLTVMQQLLAEPEVKAWVAAMTKMAMLPVKRRAKP